MEPACPAGRAALTVLAAQAATAEVQLPLILDDLDADPLHDLRVAVRRSRSVLRQLRRLLPAEPRRRHAEVLRWLQGVTGPTRDLDVLLLRWDDLVGAVSVEAEGRGPVDRVDPADRGGPTDRVEPAGRVDLEQALAPVHVLLRASRAEAFGSLATTLRGPDFGERWAAWQAFVTAEPSSAPGAVPASRVDSASGPGVGRGAGGGWPAAADRPIGRVAARRIQRVRHRMLDQGASVDAASPDNVLHDLRKRGKQLRYLLELFGATCLPVDVLEPAIDRLKELQDALGRHQDDVVHAELLRSLRPALAPGSASDGAVQLLLDELEADQRRTRESMSHTVGGFTLAAADIDTQLRRSHLPAD